MNVCHYREGLFFINREGFFLIIGGGIFFKNKDAAPSISENEGRRMRSCEEMLSFEMRWLISYCTLYCATLYCTTLYCTVLYCTLDYTTVVYITTPYSYQACPF